MLLACIRYVSFGWAFIGYVVLVVDKHDTRGAWNTSQRFQMALFKIHEVILVLVAIQFKL